MKRFGVGGLILGTILIAGIALAIGLPIALSMALFINEYAPARVRRILTTVVDLLAALPSLLYGVWGFLVLQKQLIPIATWLNAHLSAIPLFRLDPEAKLVKSSFVAGVVVGIMIMPIITSVARDVMAQVPREQCEGALALGGTKWGMIRDVILPYGRTGIVGATLLGFGRALGETIAVAVIVSLTFKVNWHVLSTGGGSIAALIASRFGEATPSEIRGLVAAGLALFFLTFVVNFIARRVVNRGAKR
jgi:phosphate transport system permease protein